MCSSHLAHFPVQQMLHAPTHLRAFMLVFPLPGTRFPLPSKGYQLSITSTGRPSCPPCLKQCYLTPHHHPRLFSRLSSWNHLIGLSYSLPPALKHAPRKLGCVFLDYRVIPNDWISDWQKKKKNRHLITISGTKHGIHELYLMLHRDAHIVVRGL